ASAITSPPTTRRPPSATLSPYTTLFRSEGVTVVGSAADGRRGGKHERDRHAPRARRRPGARGKARNDSAHDSGRAGARRHRRPRSEEHTSELQSRVDLVCRLLLEKKKDT